jgi:hypothetical protein
MKVFGIVGGLFNMPFFIFLGGLIYWGIGLMSRENAEWRPTYQHGLAVASVTALVTVPYMLIGTIMALLQPVGVLRPDQIIPSSLAYWMETDNPKLSVLYSSIDVFLLLQFVMIFLATKYTLRTKTWGAALCVALAMLMPVLRVLTAK